MFMIGVCIDCTDDLCKSLSKCSNLHIIELIADLRAFISLLSKIFLGSCVGYLFVTASTGPLCGRLLVRSTFLCNFFLEGILFATIKSGEIVKGLLCGGS